MQIYYRGGCVLSQTKEFLGTEKVGKLLVSLAVPTVIAQIVNLLYNIVDRVYIGNYDKTGLALTGVGVCLPIITLIGAFAYLVGSGGAPRASIYMGRKENDTAEKIMGNSFVFLIGISIILTAVLFIFARPILFMVGASNNTIDAALSYLQIYLIGTVFVQMVLGMNSFITAQGFSKFSMKAVLIGAVLNIVLDPIFIFVFDLGVKGAAIATIISQAVSAIWIIHFLCSEKSILRLHKKNFKIEPKVLLPCLALGLSPFIMMSTESLLTICFNSSLQRYGGDVAVGAMTILATMLQFCSLPIMGLTQGAQPITSYNFGAKKYDRVKQSFWLLLIVAVSYSALLTLLVEIAPGLFVRIFASDPTLVSYSCWALRIYFAGIFLMGAQIACQQTFIALGNAKTSVFLAILRKIILLIPLIYILPAFFEDKAFAVFLAEPVADVIAVITTIVVFTLQMRPLFRQMSEEK